MIIRTMVALVLALTVVRGIAPLWTCSPAAAIFLAIGLHTDYPMCLDICALHRLPRLPQPARVAPPPEKSWTEQWVISLSALRMPRRHGS
jgi:hypothetical protein